MSSIIAVVWDFDKTLVNGYMEDPIFEEYGVDSDKFWAETHNIAEKYSFEQGITVNQDTYYLNQFIKYAKSGTFHGLNNEKLKSFGQKLRYYEGAVDIFSDLTDIVEKDPKYRENGIRVEHFIISTGFKKIIEGSQFASLVRGCWGCELIDAPCGENGETVISEIAYTIDNTTKTRALFEINKGVGVHPSIDVNTKIPEEFRRIQFTNMIYVADGPSDIPAFSLIKRNGGSTLAVYPKGDENAFDQVETMRKDGRVMMFAEADYRKGTTAHMWLSKKIRDNADRILKQQKDSLFSRIGESSPSHLSSKQSKSENAK